MDRNRGVDEEDVDEMEDLTDQLSKQGLGRPKVKKVIISDEEDDSDTDVSDEDMEDALDPLDLTNYDDDDDDGGMKCFT